MDKFQAEKIINKYGAAIASSPSVFRKQSLLPCSKARIRLAYYVYLAAIIEDFGHLPKELGESLVSTYSMLDSFHPDEKAQVLNATNQQILEKRVDLQEQQNKDRVLEFSKLMVNALRNDNYFDEINEYIGECLQSVK